MSGLCDAQPQLKLLLLPRLSWFFRDVGVSRSVAGEDRPEMILGGNIVRTERPRRRCPRVGRDLARKPRRTAIANRIVRIAPAHAGRTAWEYFC